LGVFPRHFFDILWLFLDGFYFTGLGLWLV